MNILIRLGALGLALFATQARAHNADCDNNAAPVEVKSGCCGTEDYRALKTNEVRQDGEGYDVWLDGKWRPVLHAGSDDWIIAQPTGSPCWGVWYRRGNKDKDGNTEMWTGHEGNTEDYHFYCLEQPALF